MIARLTESLLATPWCYRASQVLLAPGAEWMLTAALKRLATKLQAPARLLDVGCGPTSWLWKVGWAPVGLDISYEYTQAFRRHGQDAITGSACELPFMTEVFDSVWCIGILHHLPDDLARRTIAEMLRVCKPDGHVIILDAVLPEHTWRRPIAALIRRLDRGRNMRRHQQLAALLPGDGNWHLHRFTYTLTALEMLECATVKSP